MQTSDKGLNVIRSFEGRALRAYKDAVGVWTIGYGNTNYDANAVKELGKIGAGLVITPEQAERLLVASIRTQYEPAVKKRLGDNVSQGAMDAGSSFHYNTGAIGKASWPTALLKGDWATVRTSLMSWNKAGGTVLSGLTRRRAREYAMAKDQDYGPEGSQGPVEIGANGRPTGKQLPPPVLTEAGQMPTPEATNTAVPGLVQLGDTGAKVLEAAELLQTLGLIDHATSTFDTKMDAAVRAYQGSHPNLTMDGKVGPATYNSLVRDIKMRTASAKTVKATVAVTGLGTAAAATGYVTLKLALIAGGLVAGVGLIFVVMAHRQELESLWNSIRGKQVP
jgi:lysozyme